MDTVPLDLKLDNFLDGQASKLTSLNLETISEISESTPPSPQSLQFPSQTLSSTSPPAPPPTNSPNSTSTSPPIVDLTDKPSLFSSPSSLFNFPSIQSSLASSLSIIQHSASGLFNQTQETTKLARLVPPPLVLERQQRIQEEVEYARQFVPKCPQFTVIRPLYCQPFSIEQQHIHLPKLSIPNPLNLLKSSTNDDSNYTAPDNLNSPKSAPKQPIPQLSTEELEKQRLAAAILKRRQEEVKLMEDHQAKQNQHRQTSGFGLSPFLSSPSSSSSNSKKNRLQRLQDEYDHDGDYNTNDSGYEPGTDDLSGLSHDVHMLSSFSNIQKRLNKARGVDIDDDEDNVDSSCQSFINNYNNNKDVYLHSTKPLSLSRTPTPINDITPSVVEAEIDSSTDPVHPSSVSIDFTQPNDISIPGVSLISPLEKILIAAEQLRQLQRKSSNHTHPLSSVSLSKTHETHPGEDAQLSDPKFNPFTATQHNNSTILLTSNLADKNKITPIYDETEEYDENDDDFGLAEGYSLFPTTFAQ